MISPKIVFEKADAELIKSLEQGKFDSLEFYRLNLRARRLLLVQGFQDAYCVVIKAGRFYVMKWDWVKLLKPALS